MDKISKFAIGVVWGLPGTVVMLLIIGIALKHSIHLFASLDLGNRRLANRLFCSRLDSETSY
ncbi:hypothetical protein [Neobacillus sp. LXY-1]|uniref:hypothetical protein n=1 Tax=Neobacillus sp. LXY-1 TaxID=3379133 RepID=UPI003EE034F1